MILPAVLAYRFAAWLQSVEVHDKLVISDYLNRDGLVLRCERIEPDGTHTCVEIPEVPR